MAIHAVDVTNVIQPFHASTNNTNSAVGLSQHANSLRKATVDVIAQNPFFPGKVSLGRQTDAERACRRQFRAGQPIIALAGVQGMCLGLGQVWLDSDDLCCFG
jgi:hypothetical protein